MRPFLKAPYLLRDWSAQCEYAAHGNGYDVGADTDRGIDRFGSQQRGTRGGTSVGAIGGSHSVDDGPGYFYCFTVLLLGNRF